MTRAGRIAREVPMLASVTLLLAGIVTTTRGHWRAGLYVVACACLVAATCRLVLPTARVGLLAVRQRGVDVAMLGGLGAATLLLAAVVPSPVT